MGKLLLLFILVPLLDAWLLFHLGGLIGFVNTILLVIATGVLGAWLFRMEGTRTWSKWQESLASGRVPEEGVLGGVMLLVGGVLLVTPGVITDAVGLLLLLPPTRKVIANFLRPRLTEFAKKKVRDVRDGKSRIRVVTFGQDPFDVGAKVREPEVGETEVVGRRVVVERRIPERREVIDADFEIKQD